MLHFDLIDLGNCKFILFFFQVQAMDLVVLAMFSLARILKSGITLVHPYSRNKSDFTDLIFSCYVLLASYMLKTLNIVKSSN